MESRFNEPHITKSSVQRTIFLIRYFVRRMYRVSGECVFQKLLALFSRGVSQLQLTVISLELMGTQAVLYPGSSWDFRWLARKGRREGSTFFALFMIPCANRRKSREEPGYEAGTRPFNDNEVNAAPICCPSTRERTLKRS